MFHLSSYFHREGTQKHFNVLHFTCFLNRAIQVVYANQFLAYISTAIRTMATEVTSQSCG